jgi:hypothetical protein
MIWKLRFYFLIGLGIVMIIFQPIQGSTVIGIIAVLGGIFWLWLNSRTIKKINKTKKK